MVRQFRFERTEFPEVIHITPFGASDDRGMLVKDYSAELFSENGISFVPVETLYIESRQGVLRGLHFQKVKQQAKLIRCLKGKVWSVVADIRKGSLTFGRWISEELSEDNGVELYVPGGFALGTLAIQDSLLSCKCGEKFMAEYGNGIRWDDSDINVGWPVDQVQELIISKNDKALQSLKEYGKAEQ